MIFTIKPFRIILKSNYPSSGGSNSPFFRENPRALVALVTVEVLLVTVEEVMVVISPKLTFRRGQRSAMNQAFLKSLAA